ncbi:MAG: outer membrane lipoprotein carrier protein LolA [Candidatus Latescibacterota bacterium]|nr:MAG: outer membrane lipoprotein carrier protein LolA [Candidatus Latescibacterota bacterium]
MRAGGWIWFLPLLLLCVTVEGAAPTAEEILKNHCRARAAIETLEMEFIETRVFTVFDEKETAGGTLYYMAPDRACWQYTAPDRSSTVMNGERGWMTFPDIKQVQTFKFEGSKTEKVLSIVGFGACGPLTDSFEVKLSAADEHQFVLEMTPTDESILAMSSRVDLTLDRADYLPRKIKIYERSGDVLLFDFSELKTNVKLDEAMFEFVVPDGYSIVEY